MEPVFFVLAIMGCADGGVQCAEARIDPARYSTVQQCMAAAPSVLARNTDIEAPVVSASCRSTGFQTVSGKAAAPRG